MGMMQYNNPVIRLMVKAANMMIVSFYWVVCSFVISLYCLFTTVN